MDHVSELSDMRMSSLLNAIRQWDRVSSNTAITASGSGVNSRFVPLCIPILSVEISDFGGFTLGPPCSQSDGRPE